MFVQMRVCVHANCIEPHALCVTECPTSDAVCLCLRLGAHSGDTFTVSSCVLARECAAALNAKKLIWITDGHRLVHRRTRELLQTIRLRDAEELINTHAGSIDCTCRGRERTEHHPICPSMKSTRRVTTRRKCTTLFMH